MGLNPWMVREFCIRRPDEAEVSLRFLLVGDEEMYRAQEIFDRLSDVGLVEEWTCEPLIPATALDAVGLARAFVAHLSPADQVKAQPVLEDYGVGV